MGGLPALEKTKGSKPQPSEEQMVRLPVLGKKIKKKI